jgi:hypothetical protein
MKRLNKKIIKTTFVAIILTIIPQHTTQCAAPKDFLIPSSLILALNVPAYLAYKKINKQPICKEEFLRDLEILKKIYPALIKSITRKKGEPTRFSGIDFLSQHKRLAVCVAAQTIVVTTLATLGVGTAVVNRNKEIAKKK